MSEPITPFIHRKVVVLREGATAYEAARAMCHQNVGSVVVSDGDGHMTGIVTDRDLTCAMISLNLSPDSELAEVMTRAPSTVFENATIEDVIAVMKENGIRRVPVIHRARNSTSERCIGMVSLDDLIVSQKISQADLSEIVRSQVFRRRKVDPRWNDRDLASLPNREQFFHQFGLLAGLDSSQALSFIEAVSGLLVRRLHFTSAAHLISFLPTQLRSELLDLPAGPDRSITGENILKELATRFDIDQNEARRRLRALWQSFSRVAPEGAEAELAEEIPDDIRLLVVPLPEGVPQTELGLRV